MEADTKPAWNCFLVIGSPAVPSGWAGIATEGYDWELSTAMQT